MRTLFKLVATALLACVSTVVALAAPPPTALTISSERGQPFSLVLDGRLLTRPLARQVHLDWLAPGRHLAEFSVPTAYGPPLHFRTSVWLEPGLSTSYLLLVRPYGPQLQQVGAVALGRPAYGPGGYPGGGYPQQPGGYYGGPASQGQGGYYDNGQAPAPSNGKGGYPAPNGGQYDNRQPNIPNGQYDNGRSGTYPGNGQYGPDPAPQAAPTYTPPPVQAPETGGTHVPPAQVPNQGGSYVPPAPSAGEYPGQNGGGNYPAPDSRYTPGTPAATSLSPLAVEEIADLAEAMRKQPSDDERVEMAKQTLDQSSVSTADLVELLQTLTVEEARIDLAEFGYAHVVDPQNFGRVYAVFQSHDSVQEVQRAVGSQR